METKNIPFEIKNIGEDGSFIAYGSTFGNEDLGGDVVVKGAFTKTLKENDIKDVLLLAQHDTGEIIGEFKSIVEDEKGLLVEGQLFINDIKRAAETRFLMLKNLLKSMSIGFRIPKGGAAFENGVRLLKEISLVEISVVTFPMNEEAEILGVKNMNLSKCETLRDFEECLRDSSNFSKKEAQEFISSVKNLLRDSEDEEKDVPKTVVVKESVEEKQDDLSEVILALKQNNKILKG